MEADQVIIEPVLTEKTSLLKEQKGRRYVFKVHVRANKHQIREALTDLFSVRPTKCNVVRMKGKKKANTPIGGKSTKRGYGRTAAWKKAIVTLPEGEKIDVFEGT